MKKADQGTGKLARYKLGWFWRLREWLNAPDFKLPDPT